MKYFVIDSQRESTCYHEFYKGKWNGYTFWRDDSISLHDNVLYENKGFIDAIVEVIPEYSPFGETEISFVQWAQIGKRIMQKDFVSQELYAEADEWVQNVFREYDCFTILGI